MRKRLLSMLVLLMIAVTGVWADDEAVTYALKTSDSFTSGQTVEVKNAANDVVATITYGESGGANFNSPKKDNHVEGFSAYTEGNGTNGDKTGGTFYTITPKVNATITVAVMLNADKAFYILEDGTALANYDGITVSSKYYGTYEFDATANKAYKFYCAGSKLGFYGFKMTNITASGLKGSGTQADPYLIGSADDWSEFCTNFDKYKDGYLALTADISVGNTKTPHDTPFSGTFSGNDHKLTVALESTTSRCAPFQFVNGGTIKNLHVDGTISTSGGYSGGIVGACLQLTLTGCRSSVAFTGTGGRDIGGLVGCMNTNGKLIVTDCLFDGSINASETSYCAGIVGTTYKSGSNITFTYCLVNPGTVSVGNGGHTIANTGASIGNTNYYVTAIGAAQGNDASGMSAAQLAEALGMGWQVIDGKVLPRMNPDLTDLVINGDLEGSDLQCFFAKEHGKGSENATFATVADGVGKDGSRAIVVQSSGNEVNAYDTQFFIRLPYELPAGTKYRLTFDYKADNPNKCSFESHNEPEEYIIWYIGSNVPACSFKTDWDTYDSGELEVPAECDGTQNGDYKKNFQTITFDLANNQKATEFIIDNIKVEVLTSALSGLTSQPYIEALIAKAQALVDAGGDAGAVGNLQAAIATAKGIANPTFDDILALQAAIDQFQQESTGITSIKDDKVESVTYYDLNGRRIDHPAKGVYVKNGKKVVVK